MDAIWNGIAKLMEWIFKLIKPVGPYVDILFFLAIFVGVVYWLWYDMHERKGGRNYMADKGGKKS